MVRQCDFCTDGLTYDRGAKTCKKTGVCSTIGNVPFYKASGTCMPCPPMEEVGTAFQMIVVLALLGGGGFMIWLTSGVAEAAEVRAAAAGSAAAAAAAAAAPADAATAAQGVDGAQMSGALGPITESVLIMLPTFQFIATAFSFDFGWPSAIRTLGKYMKVHKDPSCRVRANPLSNPCCSSYVIHARRPSSSPTSARLQARSACFRTALHRRRSLLLIP